MQKSWKVIKKGKVLVLGLDGVSFNVLNPLLKKGVVPNIKRLIQEGVSGELQTCYPPITCPNWKCYSTGKNPGNIGVFWWEKVDWKNKKIDISFDVLGGHKEIWDYLSEANKKVGIMNFPLTYPPKQVNGFMISGPPMSHNSGFAYPSYLEEDLKKNYNYVVNPEGLGKLVSKNDAIAKGFVDLINTRFIVFRKLIEKYKPDFVNMTIFHMNSLNHFYWERPIMEELWKLIDKHLDYFIKEGHTILVISDHGSNRIEQVFNINEWLKHNNYLFTKKSYMNFLNKFGLNKRNISRISEMLGIKELLKVAVSKQVVKCFPTEQNSVKGIQKEKLIDWDKSKAIASGQGPVYINPGLQQSDREELINRLTKEAEQIVDPVTKKKIAKKIYRKEQIYKGKFLSEAPDLIVDMNEGMHISDNLGKGNIFGGLEGWIAENKMNGILVAWGQGIRKNVKIENATILDIAPTVLSLMDVKVPEEMEGKVLDELFENEKNE